MFKKTKLAAAMLAVVATSAQAVHVSPSGTGQVLVYPYYNVNNGFQTQLSVVNTTNDYKAVKIRFRESGVSNDVLDFNIYMSPEDVWTATIRNVGNKANIITADNTCTLPALPDDGISFITAYDNTDDADAREGYVELIEMGEVDPTQLVAPALPYQPDPEQPAYNPLIVEGLLHDSDGMPADCGVVANAWLLGGFTEGGANVNLDLGTPGSPSFPSTAGTNNWTINPNGLLSPDGGLFGNTILLNTQTGSAYVIDPVAFQNYANNDIAGADAGVLDSSGAQHYVSDDQTDYLLPSLASGNVFYSDRNIGIGTVDILWTPTLYDYGLFDTNVAPNTMVPSGLNPFPMAAAIQVQSFAGEYFVEESFDGATDWIVTMPMKKHGIFSNDYLMDETVSLGDECDNGTNGDEQCLLPLTAAMSGGAADVEVAVVTFDREEQLTIAAAPPPGFSPPIQVQADTFSLTREVNILAMSLDGNVPDNNVLGSEDAKAVKVDFEKGWAEVTFNGRYDLIDTAAGQRYQYLVGTGVVPGWNEYSALGGGGLGVSLTGVPVIGTAATRGNTDSAGTATVGETYPLKVVAFDALPGI